MFLEDGRRLRWPRLPPLRLESWSLIWIGGGTCEYQCSQDALESLSSAVSIKQKYICIHIRGKGHPRFWDTLHPSLWSYVFNVCYPVKSTYTPCGIRILGVSFLLSRWRGNDMLRNSWRNGLPWTRRSLTSFFSAASLILVWPLETRKTHIDPIGSQTMSQCG